MYCDVMLCICPSIIVSRLFIYLSFHLSISPAVHLSIHLSLRPSTHLALVSPVLSVAWLASSSAWLRIYLLVIAYLPLHSSAYLTWPRSHRATAAIPDDDHTIYSFFL